MSNPMLRLGVYVQVVPGRVHTILPSPTSRTAFVGRALRGPVNQPISLASFTEYARDFGGVWTASAMSSAVRDFFANGGTEAYRAGAVPGSKPTETFFVRCDSSTTVASDIHRGIFHLPLGFAPLTPAELVTMKLELRAAPP